MSNSHPGGVESPSRVVCRPAKAAEIHAAAALILSVSHRPASSSQVAEFVQFAVQRNIDVHSVWIADAGGTMLWAALPMVSPGRTMLLFVPSRLTESMLPGAKALIQRICDHYALRDIQLAQVLIDPEHPATRPLFASLQFADIAELIYLQVQPHRASKWPILKPGMGWLTYSPATHDLFAQAILESYQQSLDCPALSGMRYIDDVIAGHKATGDFDPLLWQVLTEQNQSIGVLLLSRIPNGETVELVYLGVAASARGRGLGKLMMHQALRRIIDDNRSRLTLAVDSKNEPALRLYYGFGMQRIASRLAMIRDLRTL